MHSKDTPLASLQSPASIQTRWLGATERYNSIIIWLLLVAYGFQNTVQGKVRLILI